MNDTTGFTTEGVTMQGLTARQQEVLDFIAHFIDTNGYSPSLKEILDHFGFRSMQAVSTHLKRLEQKGYLKRVKGLARTITLTEPDQNTKPN